jgi:hypothetical protein
LDGEKKMKIFEAMVFKRKIGSGCSLDVKMLDTLKDGIVLSIEEELVDNNNLDFIKEFVNQHNLNLLLESERYFISTNELKPSILSIWDN